MMNQSPAFAFGWMIWRRNRLTALGVLGYSTLVTATSVLMPIEDAYHGITVLLCLPSLFVCIWLLGEFTFSGEFDLTSGDSGFPQRMFALPVSSRVLVALPMVYGGLAIAVSWIIFSLLFVRPRGLELPLFWPSMFALALLGWMQALSWRSFPSGWLRILLSVVWLSLVVGLTVYAVQRGISEWLIGGACLVQFGIAYLLAWHGVASARCGDTGQTWTLPNFSRLFEPRLPRHFRSSLHAQSWYERSINGASLPLMTVFLSIVVFVGVFLMSRGDTAAALRFGAVLYFFPILFCVSTASTMARFNRKQLVGQVGLFLATRPITTSQLLQAKLSAITTAVVTSYLIIVFTFASLCVFTGCGEVLLDGLRGYANTHSAFKLLSLIAFVVVAGPLMSWLSISAHLWLGLTGRRWMGATLFFVALGLALGFFMISMSVLGPAQAQRLFSENFVWIIGPLAILKVTALLVVCGKLVRSQIISTQTIVLSLIAWLFLVAYSTTMLTWFLEPSATWVRCIPFAATFLTPAVGIALAPLALEYNRRNA